jgi:hypothetical protein
MEAGGLDRPGALAGVAGKRAQIDRATVIPIDQSTPDNCVSACIASILEIPLADVPAFMAPRDDRGWERAAKWLAARGYRLVDRSHGFGRGYVLLRGVSPRGSRHCVVGFDGKIVHDPYPTRAGLDTIDFVTELIRTTMPSLLAGRKAP